MRLPESLRINKLPLEGLHSPEFARLADLAMEGSQGRLNLLKCSDYDSFPPDIVRMFTHVAARYLLPTVELVECLKGMIGGLKAIEIGSGSGDLARFLGIPATDSYNQAWPEVRAYYKTIGQPTIRYGSNVERLDALEAVEKYKPDIVIGAWVTQWIDPNLPFPESGGSMYGVREDELLAKVPLYIVVGAEGVHGGKKILRQPHKVINAERIARSRRTDNRIWVWGTL